MIPRAYITHWRQFAPWPDDTQIEQDLILSRVIVEIFSDPLLKKELAFRGGTALHKLFFASASRYSEDIDLVRTTTGPIKNIVDRLRDRLDHWLGKPKTLQNNASFKLKYGFNPENSPDIKQNIKIEINTRENLPAYAMITKEFSIQSDWFSGVAQVNTYQFEELLATKLRALYQRKKGRDLFDLWVALQHKNVNTKKIVDAFQHYMKKTNNVVTKSVFEKNLDAKLTERNFQDDISALLSTQHGSVEKWDINKAAVILKNEILIYLPN